MALDRGSSLPRQPPCSLLVLLLVLLLAAVLPACGLRCLQEGDMIENVPREVNTEPGKTFRITCMMDPTKKQARGLTADNLYFTRDFKDLIEEVPASQYTVYNSTTLVLEDSLETAVHYKYSCRLRANGTGTNLEACSSFVNIGYPPLDVKNFSCLSWHWSKITCNWQVPYNAITSQYQLQYRLNSYYDSSDSTRREQWALCPDYDNDRHRTSCTMTGQTQPVYRRGADFYNFTMNITNALGTRLQWLGVVDNFAIVLPPAPDAVRNTSVTKHSVMLETEVGWPMSQFPRPLDFEVSYTSPWDEEPQFVNASSMSQKPAGEEDRRPLLVTGLRPYTEYQFSVRMRSGATDRDDMWSPPARLAVRTLAAVPAAAPRVDVGSFQVVGALETRAVYVYWRQIAAWQRNGPGFRYCVTGRAGDAGELRPDEVTDAYARFSGVSLRRLTFQLAACNALGRSRQTSALVVPDREQMRPLPEAMTLLIYGTGQYQLFWQYTAEPDPASFTLFWCDHRLDQPYQCRGQLEMLRVPGAARGYNLTLPSGYQFAVSANYLTDDGELESSGMVWSRCSILFSKDGGQMVEELFVASTGANYVTLAWNKDCSSQATASDFIVYYCRLLGNVCMGDEKQVKLSGPISAGLRVDGLQPYSEYRLSVALVIAGVEGRRSAHKMVQTLQARPDTPPTVTEVTAVSNTSLRVKWRAPVRPNGRLLHYIVRVADKEEKVLAAHTTLTVDGLRPYTAYNVTVQACNERWPDVGCSPRSPPVSNRTLVGVPGRMEPPRIQLLNASAVLVRWRPPEQPGGPQPALLVRTVSEEDGVNHTSTTLLSDGQLEAELPVRPCRPGVGSQRHLFWVRAETRPASGAPLAGPWSGPTQQRCVLAAGWPTGAVAGAVIGGCALMGLAVFGFICLCSRTKRKWLKMRDIGVNLPSGLDRLEKPALNGFGGPERRGAAAAGYGRLVSPSGELGAGGGTSGRPLLQEECSPVQTTDVTEASRSTGTDGTDSCSSSATNYTDSGAESEKVGSPTYEGFPWPDGAPKLTPYVQVGGSEVASGRGPHYAQFSPYVDARAIQSLLARSMQQLPADGAAPDLSRSEPDLSSAGGGSPPALPYVHLGHRSSTGYVSMASDDALAPAGRRQDGSPPARAKAAPPAGKAEPQGAYVALGPPPPPASAAGFPPYVLAGLPADSAGWSGGGGPRPSPARPPPPPADAGYVARSKLQPAGIELCELAAAGGCAEPAPPCVAEPVLSPKKLQTVASAREPYCRVVTSHRGPPDLGPNVSMV